MRLRLALCKELGMTPSQLANNATQDDIIMLAAYFEILNDEMPAIPQDNRLGRR